MTALSFGSAIHRAIADTSDHLRAHADAIAAEHGENNATALAAIWEGVRGQFDGGTPGELDGRTAKWRCRFRFYRADEMSEPQADTDAELPADAPGSMVVAGLPNVAHEVLMLAQHLHGGMALRGLSREELDRRLRGLRPTLSRRGGNAVWRVPYDTLETFDERALKQGWLCRVDIQREESGK